MKRRIFLFLLILCITAPAFAQFYESGQDPASFRWKQMKTPHFNLLYPDSAENIARQLSRSLEAGYEKGAYSLQVQPKKITVLLHPSSVFSNAFVAWAPRRMEFVTTPPQNNDAQNWNDQLATHEFRHLVQLTSVNRGLTRVLSWFFGEQITAGVMGAFVPFWFIEGDATLSETLLSNAGRGRLPSFDVELRAQLIEKGPYHYDKAVFGSYKDFVPDHYVLGYHIVTLARREYGASIWDNALHKAGACPVMITPFNHEIRKISGLSKVKLYKRSMQQLDSIWRTDLPHPSLPPSRKISPENKNYTNYLQPSSLSDTSVITLKSGIDDVRKVVEIDHQGNSKTLFRIGYYSNSSLSSAGNTIMWAEAGSDPRWENRNYSNIWSYDLKKHCKKKLTSRSRLFAPALSPDSKNFTCIAMDLKNINALEIRDSRQGDLIRQLKFPEGTQLMTPSWSKDGGSIVMVLLNAQGKFLAIADTGLRHISTFKPSGLSEMTCPVMHNNNVYFSSGTEGIDNIYIFDTLSLTTSRVTNAKHGAYEPEISGDGKTIIYSEYTPDGYIVAEIASDPSAWVAVDQRKPLPSRLFEPLLVQEQGLVKVEDTTIIYPSKRYYKFTHLLNPHSWGPISVNADRQTVNPGVTLMSQNKLTTLVGTLGWEYSIMQRTGTWFADVSFRQWYPIVEMKFSYGSRSAANPDSIADNSYFWDETSLRTSVRLPLNLSSGNWSRWLQLRISNSFYQIDHVRDYPEDNFKGYIRTLDYQCYWSSQAHTTQKDIEPRWGQVLIADYRHTPFDGVMLGDMIAVRTVFYFPGIGRHHSFYIQAALQKNTDRPFKYADIISYPRGVRNAYDDQFTSLSANYTLPLLYPDMHCGSVFYMKRIWLNAFYDYAQGSYNHQTNIYTSAGAELYTDIHFFRFLAPFSLGIRGSWLTTENRFVPEFLYSINLSGIQ